jgi:hypothetical protein
LRSNEERRFVRLRPLTQFIIIAILAAFIAWSIITTSVWLMHSIGSGNFHEQPKRDQPNYQQRLQEIEFERNERRQEAILAHIRFELALREVSQMQSQLFDPELKREELKTAFGILQDRLRQSLEKNQPLEDESTNKIDPSDTNEPEISTMGSGSSDIQTITFLNDSLNTTAIQRDQSATDAVNALKQVNDITLDMRLMEERNEQVFRQIEEALTV